MVRFISASLADRAKLAGDKCTVWGERLFNDHWIASHLRQCICHLPASLGLLGTRWWTGPCYIALTNSTVADRTVAVSVVWSVVLYVLCKYVEFSYWCYEWLTNGAEWCSTCMHNLMARIKAVIATPYVEGTYIRTYILGRVWWYILWIAS